MTISEGDEQQEKVTGWSGIKRKNRDQGDTVKRVRIFMGTSVWDEGIRKYRKASWCDAVPLHTLFNRMMVPYFDESGYWGGHQPRCARRYENGVLEYNDEHFVVFLSHFFPREAAQVICELVFGEGWDVVHPLWWSHGPKWGERARRPLIQSEQVSHPKTV